MMVWREKLSTCPFCGGPAKLKGTDQKKERHAYIRCRRCGARGPVIIDSTGRGWDGINNEAVDGWNTRCKVEDERTSPVANRGWAECFYFSELTEGCCLLTERLCLSYGECGFYRPRCEEPQLVPVPRLTASQVKKICAFVANHSQVKETARALGVDHRDLRRTFDSVENCTGLDPREPDDLARLLEICRLIEKTELIK